MNATAACLYVQLYLLRISCVVAYNMTMYIMHYSAFLEQVLLNYISLLRCLWSTFPATPIK